METLLALVSIFTRLWNTGNRWARLAIICIVVFPAMLLALSTGNWKYAAGVLAAVWVVGILIIAAQPAPSVGNRRDAGVQWSEAVAILAIAVFGVIWLNEWMFAVAILGLVPATALLILVLSRVDPLVVAVLALFESGQTVLRWIATIVGMEMVAAFILASVPVSNDPRLIFWVALATVAIAFLSIGVQGRLVKTARALLALLIIAALAAFFFGGREKVINALSAKPCEENDARERCRAELATDPLFKQHIVPMPEMMVNENGLLVPKQSSKMAKLVTQRFGTRIEVVRKEDGGEEIGVRTDCSEIVKVAELAPGETLEIVPFPQPHADLNRCSFTISDILPPPFYEVEGDGKVNDPSHAELLPCKEAPAQINVFLVKDSKGKLIHCGWFTQHRRIVQLENRSEAGTETFSIWHAYNSSQAGQPGSQIGLVRGATITFKMTKTKLEIG